MPISKRRIKVRPSKISPEKALERMGDLLAAGHGTEADAQTYFTFFYKDQLARLQSIASRAERERNWEFMAGCVKQATELYVLASVLYEKFPEHVMLSDGAYDGLARWLNQRRDEADPEFWNWYNVTSMGLKAGSGYNLAVRPPIAWMVWLITGEDIEETDGTPARNRARVLPRRKSVKGSKRVPSADRGTGKGNVRRGKRLRKPNTKGKDT